MFFPLVDNDGDDDDDDGDGIEPWEVHGGQATVTASMAVLLMSLLVAKWF